MLDLLTAKAKNHYQQRQLATTSFAQLGGPVVQQRFVRVSVLLVAYAYFLSVLFHMNLRAGLLEAATLLVSPSVIGSTLLVYGALLLTAYVHFKMFRVERVSRSGYFQRLQLLLRDYTGTGAMVGAYLASAAILNFVLARTLGHDRNLAFWVYPSRELDGRPRVNPLHLANRVGTLALGVAYPIRLIASERLHLQFPVVEQHRVHVLRDRLPGAFCTAVGFAYAFLSRFWLAYLLLGPGLYAAISTCAAYLVQLSPHPVQSPVWSPNALAFLFLSAACTVLSWELALQVFEVVFTELARVSELSLDPNACMVDGLRKAGASGYLRCLAYRELHAVSTAGAKRRKAIYRDISRASGTIWQQVCQQCLEVVDDATAALRAANGAAPGPTGPPAGEAVGSGGAAPHDVLRVPSGKAASVAATAASGSPARPQRSLEEVVLASLRDALLQSSLGKRILSQLSQGHTFNAFSNFEVQVWALRSLAMFVHHSLDEDDFGVVQKDIPAIMTSLLAYLAQLELFIMDAKGAGYSSSWANSGARMPAAVAHNRQLAFNSQLAHPQAHALIQVVRNCLYIFTVTFFDHLDEFKFPTHVRQHLELFKTFQA